MTVLVLADVLVRPGSEADVLAEVRRAGQLLRFRTVGDAVVGEASASLLPCSLDNFVALLCAVDTSLREGV